MHRDLEIEGIARQSAPSVNAYDNGLMECLIGLSKTKCVGTTLFHSGPYKTIAGVEYATMAWVDWYTNRRLYSTSG